MTNAYNELYLSRARITLGSMLHFAVYDLGRDISSFFESFISSGFASRFGKGEPKVTVGLSGPELAYEVIYKTTGQFCNVKPVPADDKTPEYWAGWALAYYEWYRNIPFEDINRIVPVSEVVKLYDPLHEADIMKFVDIMDGRIDERFKKDQLSRLRTYAGMTQKILAEKSGVSVRMIEQYEQERKDINHASADTVYRLSKALGCTMEELIGRE
ncbi:MAG: helix-turn-helix domain-containing protein [Lachnospiraceae bacterium]|nr:helix-turn-helix domain-containing protein [Lachnospiraceae bacterium]